MKKYVVNCWARISAPIEVEAASEDEAADEAWAKFEDMDFNKCGIGDVGTDVSEAKGRQE